MKFGFIIDNRRCIGCHACTVACKAEHEVPIGINRTWVKYIEKGEFPDTRRIFSVMRCNHCDNSPCVTICPTSALFTRSDGIVDFDNRRCIGCKACTQACPYDAIYIDPETQTAGKCNYCAHRVETGLEPACVNVCPTQAIISGDMENPNSTISKMLSREQVTVRKPEKNTEPKLFYIEGDEVSLTPLATNPSDNYFWNNQSKGVGHHQNAPQQKFNIKIVPDAGFAQTSSVQINQKGEQEIQIPVNGNPEEIQKYAKSAYQETAATQPRRVYDSPAKGVLWGWEVLGYILTKAISVGVFLIPLCLQFFGIAEVSPSVLTASAWVSLVFLALTGVLLVKDLDQPKRFLYVLLRPHWSSWLVKGAYCILGYGAFLTLWILLDFFAWNAWQFYLDIPLILFGLLTSVYTAFLFAQAKGRDFWQNPLTFFHMLNHSVVSGAICLIFMDSIGWISLVPMPIYQQILAIGLVFNLLSTFAELLTPHVTQDSARTIAIMTKGVYKNHFWIGSVLIGNLLPLLMIYFVSFPFSVVVSSCFALAGLFFFIRIWLIAPQMNALS